LALDAGQVSLDVHPDVTGFATELKAKLLPIANKAEKDLNKIGVDRSVRSRLFGFLDMAGSKFGQLNRTIKGVGGSAGGLGKVFGLIKWPAIIAGVDVLAAGIGALVAGTIQLIAGLAPLTGILVMYPAIAGAVGQAFGVVTLALSGVSTAFKLAKTGGEEYKAALMALSPTQRLFVEQLVEAKEQFAGLKEIAAEELLPGLGESVQRLAQVYLPAVTEAVRATAVELSSLSVKFTDLFASDAFVTDIAAISQNNVTLLGSLGAAALGFANGLRHIVAEAQPFVLWMGKALEAIGENFASRMEELRTSGSLAAFFDTTRESASAFGEILSNVGHILFNVLQIAQPLGQSMLDNFALATQGWQDFTETISGRTQIFAFFQDAQPTLKAFSSLLRDIVSAFFELARSPGMAEVIDALRTQLLPFIVSIGQTATGQLLPALIDLGEQFLRIFQMLGSETPILIGFVKTITSMVTVFLDVLDIIPGLKGLVVTLFALSKVMGILGVGTLIRVIANFKMYSAVMTAAGTTTMTTSGIIASAGKVWLFFTGSLKGVIRNLGAMIGLGPKVAMSMGSAALGAVGIGVALGIAAKIAIEAMAKSAEAANKIAEIAGASLVKSKQLFKMSTEQFIAFAAAQDMTTVVMSRFNTVMGQTSSHVSVYTSSWETLEQLVQQGKISLNEAADGFLTMGLSTSQAKVELEKLSIQMFNTGKITRDQLVTRLLSLGFTYEEATGRANALNQTLRTQAGVIGGVTQKVKVFTFSSMEAFREWGNTVKTNFRSFVNGAKSFKEAFNLTTKALMKNMRIQVRVARQGALDMAELGDLAIPPGFKQWLMEQGPATIRAFVSGNETQQGIMRKSWTATKGFVDKYGTAVDNLPKSVKTTAQFDTRAATIALMAYRDSLLTVGIVPDPIEPPPGEPGQGGQGGPGGPNGPGIAIRPTRALISEKSLDAIIPVGRFKRAPMKVEIVDSNLDLVMMGVVRDEDDFLSRRERANR